MLVSSAIILLLVSLPLASTEMSCKYGDRGSLTAVCTNAVPSFFKETLYRFDHLDETLVCEHCNLANLEMGTFDITGNKIRSLDLYNCNIVKILEQSFTGLIYLKRLNLNGNRINVLKPTAFLGAKKIEEIMMNYALTAPLSDFAFDGLKNLKRLYLSENNLAVLRSKTFYGLNNLEYLNLQYNELTTLNNSLSYLKNLKIVLLAYNKLKIINPSDFLKLNRLLQIDLSNNVIHKFNLNLSRENNLRTLLLSTNNLAQSFVNEGVFENLNQLEILTLDQNMLEYVPIKFFMGLYNLRELTLACNYILDMETGAFTGMPSLRTLNMSHNKILTAETTGNRLLPQLHILDLSFNNLTSFDFIGFISRLPKIYEIDLQNNSLRCETKRQLQTSFQDENIKLTVNADECPLLTAEEIEKTKQQLKYQFYEKQNDGITALTTFSYVLLILVILLIGLLYYIQFYVLFPHLSLK